MSAEPAFGCPLEDVAFHSAVFSGVDDVYGPETGSKRQSLGLGVLYLCCAVCVCLSGCCCFCVGVVMLCLSLSVPVSFLFMCLNCPPVLLSPLHLCLGAVSVVKFL